ncbi:MAG: hypothetical protein L0287_35840, partial [Anaerolineae bacterium]|nr:hypothetical protein [Anaerolineae bacterium]
LSRTVPGKPFGLMSESVSTDFHELRQGFIPPIRGMKNGLGHAANETVSFSKTNFYFANNTVSADSI